ncbi:MAG TPA: ABC transporter ATP-binding protein [Trebonia sp.]|jgi:ABC-2 type transport system ATP-binding protein|nr:ABC transporter ATP-binding protein [Trebonia sp.]
MNSITVNNLVKRFGAYTAVDGVSFAAPAGQVTALLGPNGAGKTTTIEILEGFQAPTSGAIAVLGVSPRHGGRRWRSRIGLVLQSTSLDSQLTVTEALSLYGSLYAAPRRIGEVLDVIDLKQDARTRIGALSGGQRRRVDLGIAIIGRPEVLFLDEPTTGLDPEARRRLWSVIENLTAAGATVLLTTHYLDEAQHLAAKVVVLADGRVVADATPDELRAMGGAPVIRYRLPAIAPALPRALTPYLDAAKNELTVPSDDVTADLGTLVTWAREHSVDLTGLEVGSPSLEDAYLSLTRDHENPGPEKTPVGAHRDV